MGWKHSFENFVSKTKREEAGESQEMQKVEDIGAEQRRYKIRFMTVIFQGKCNRIVMSTRGPLSKLVLKT